MGAAMRGTDEMTASLFSYVDLEERIPARHPLRKVRQIVNDALASRAGCTQFMARQQFAVLLHQFDEVVFFMIVRDESNHE